LKIVFDGGLPIESCPRAVEDAATTPPQKPPKINPADMCITKEVDPRADTFNSVVLCSTKKAIKMKLRRGQIPGEGCRWPHAIIPIVNATVAMVATKMLVLVADLMDWNSSAGDRGIRP
jgi:hypothetical protein